MTAQPPILHIPVDRETETKAAAALEALGLSMSDAVTLFLRRVAADQALPIEIKVPNAETRAAMDEAEAIVRTRHRRLSADALVADLEEAGDR